VWLWALSFCVVLLYFNSRSVSNFGTIESWFALIKVAAIVLFIILGAAGILGLGHPGLGFRNLWDLPGGFLPKGLSGVWMAVIVGIFSFNGIEVIAVTSGEAQDPRSAIPAALRTMLLRLFLFYVLAVTIIVATVPWTATGVQVVAQSPFVTVFQRSGIRHAAGIMNFVVISAALSSMNTNVYLCSRMLFSLARGQYAPQLLGTLSDRGVPVAAILISGACIMLAAAVSILTPNAYGYLLGVALFAAILVWMFILASHLSFRRHHATGELPVRMPLFPWMQYAGLLMLAAILVTMGIDRTLRVSWEYGVPWLLLVSAAYFIGKARRGATVPAPRALLSREGLHPRYRP
jgi:amino acid transporter, AAT family